MAHCTDCGTFLDEPRTGEHYIEGQAFCGPCFAARTGTGGGAREQVAAGVAPADDGSGAIISAVFLALVGLALILAGFWRMYTYNAYDDADKVVGGDAYNYIILGLRGLGFIGAGVGALVLSALSGIMGLRSAVLSRGRS